MAVTESENHHLWFCDRLQTRNLSKLKFDSLVEFMMRVGVQARVCVYNAEWKQSMLVT
jgi:hypothetical protein